jgi:hypothetical protein
MRMIRMTFGAILLGLMVSACASEPARNEAGQIEEEGELSVFNFRVGDCFDDPSTTSDEVSDVAGVPCSGPHDNEVFHLYDLPDGSFPGSAAIDASVETECLTAFEDYVGISYQVSELFFFPLTPTEASWAQSDREVACALYADGEQLTGSMKGSSR